MERKMYRYNAGDSTIETSGEMPGRPQLNVLRAVRFLFDQLALWQERRRQRAALMKLDGRLLRDIGLSLSDVEHEIRKPFWR
jgi:uncharacterized protein YjiS (DUF1127 family)